VRKGRLRGIGAALEPFVACAGRRVLPLAAATAGLTHARADAAADAHALFARTWFVSDLVKFHRTTSYCASPTTRTKCWTLRIIPRVAGVSGRSRMRLILLRPSPISVAR